MRHRDGFTLAELLVVVAIIAILVTVVIPIFSDTQDKSRRAVCDHNRTQIEREFTIMKLSGMEGTNQDILDSIIGKYFEEGKTGCPYEESVYSYKYLKEDGNATSARESDAVRVHVSCSIPGHGNTSLQLAQISISEWISGYSGSSFGNNVVDAYVRANGGKGYLLSDDEILEMFGEKYSFANEPKNLYLKPLGATVLKDGKQQVLNIQMVTETPGGVNSAGDMRTYALIVNGQVYAMKNESGQIQDGSRIGGNGPLVLEIVDYNSGNGNNNTSYSSEESFIEQITRADRKYPYELIG